MKRREDVIALFDMDGVLCNYNKAFYKDLENIRSPQEPKKYSKSQKTQNYFLQRSLLIRKNEEWWISLPRFKLGWDILKMVKKLGLRVIILSKSPSKTPAAYSGKKRWIENNLGNKTEVIVLNSDKGLVYGRILVEDNPVFIRSWLNHRPRGLAIMIADKKNKNFKHEQVIRYTGKNSKQVWKALKDASHNTYK